MDVSQLKRIPLFESIPDEDLKSVATFAVGEEYPEGTVVVKEGAFSNHFYAIEDGTASVEVGGEHVADLERGDVFGEQGLLEGQERSARWPDAGARGGVHRSTLSSTRPGRRG